MKLGLYISASILPIFVDVTCLPGWAFITYYALVLLNLANVVRLTKNAQKRK